MQDTDNGHLNKLDAAGLRTSARSPSSARSKACAPEQTYEFRYGFETTLKGISYDRAIVRVTDELKQEGFSIVTEFDVKATLEKKLSVDFRRYMILGACNPGLAHRALKAEAHIGLLLPCSIVVQETSDGDLLVSIVDPRAMFALVDNMDVLLMADEANERLRRVIDALTAAPEGKQ